jgi:hypothetical protein
MNFVVENSEKYKKLGLIIRENELNVFTFRANNICYIIYP